MLNTETKFGKCLTKILKEMCKRVNADYNKIDFSSSDWFTKYEWSLSEQDEFKKWLISYLYDNKKAREEICEIPIKTKKYLRKVVDIFLFNYGWKFNDYEKEIK